MIEFKESDIDEIIKREIFDEADAAPEPTKAKVYPKVAGLTNIGRTYFANVNEIVEKNQNAQTQMAQRYGAEIYGVQGHLGSQRTNSGDKYKTGTGTQNSQLGTNSGLIKCQVNSYLTIPGKGFKESVVTERSFGGSDDEVGYDEMVNGLKKLASIWSGTADDSDIQNFLNASQITVKKEDWVNAHKEAGKKLTQWIQKLNKSSGANDKDNKNAWDNIVELMTKDKATRGEFNDRRPDTDKQGSYKYFYNQIVKAQKGWTEGKGGSSTSGMGNEDPTQNAKQNGSEWNPNYTFKIDIQTNFNEEWFQRKFKSGFLNKAIMAVKTSAATKMTKDASWNNHQWSATEMEPREKRKLDSIQWKMTNKVAKDYITYLLGWSRKKVYKKGEDGNPVASEALSEDKSFGQKMANKALNNRGILGRLKQKIFSGQQSNNVISVVFQLADPWDGSWTEEEADTPAEKPTTDAAPEGGEAPEGKPEEKEKGKPTRGGFSMVGGGGNFTQQTANGVKQADAPQATQAKVNGTSQAKAPSASKANAPQASKADAPSTQKADAPGAQKADAPKTQQAATPKTTQQNPQDTKKAEPPKTTQVKESEFSFNLDEDTLLKLVSEDVEIESDRYNLVKEICESGNGIDELVDNCLNGEIWK